MPYLRVELEPDQIAALHRGDRGVGGGGENLEAVRQTVEVIAMAHPDIERAIEAREHAEARRSASDLDRGRSILAPRRRGDIAAEGVGKELHAVADPEHRNLPFQHPARQLRGIRSVDTGGASRKDDPLRRKLGDLLP